MNLFRLLTHVVFMHLLVLGQLQGASALATDERDPSWDSELELLRSQVTADLTDALSRFELSALEPIYSAVMKKASKNPKDYLGTWKWIGDAHVTPTGETVGVLFGQKGLYDSHQMPLAFQLKIIENPITEQYQSIFTARHVRQRELGTILYPAPLIDRARPVSSLATGGITTFKAPIFKSQTELWFAPFGSSLDISSNAWEFNCGRFSFPKIQGDFLLCQVGNYEQTSISQLGQMVGRPKAFIGGGVYLLFTNAVTEVPASRDSVAQPVITVPTPQGIQLDIIVK